MPTTPSTAVLLFSRSASAEAAAKGFGPGGQRVTTAMIRRTSRTIERSGLPVFRSDQFSQSGDSFGQRLANAVRRVFASGVDRLIVVGNDCPYLTSNDLRRAARHLASGRSVVGPDRRGGVYLLGLQAADFCAATFAALPWETDELAGALTAGHAGIALLPRRSDLNGLLDFRTAWHSLRRLFAELYDLITSRAALFSTTISLCPVVLTSRSAGRAPPVG